MRSILRCATLALAFFALAAAGTGQALAVGTPAGTTISNQATVSYADSNGNPLVTLSNIVTTTVSQVASLTVDPDGTSAAAPGDLIYYAHDVTNPGNGNDTIDVAAVSSNGWATALYADNDSSGTFTAGDTLLADTDGDTVVDTGLMSANAIFKILARVTVPAGTASGTVDTMTVTGTSSFNLAISDTATDITTVNAPDMSVVKSVLPVGSQPPGATLTYTVVVTNNGSGSATSVVLTDPIPANTTYVAGSITLNAVSKTDVALDDEGDFNVTTAGAVTVSIGLLAPGASATVTFQVTIN
ncbi:MAG TPA: hypothetical protein VGK94_01105 [Candidatus Polarisedimenticolia bacterium]|jgi:uncharacterized repeat protein (TIGR01451 family)